MRIVLDSRDWHAGRNSPHDWHGDVALPFYHLGSDGFWHLKPRPGSEPIVSAGRRLISIRQLHDHTLGAELDQELFLLLHDERSRELLRATLIEAHFAPQAHAALLEQGRVNTAAFKYSQRLLEQARQDQESKRSQEVPEPVRNQGFRRAVVIAYSHRCALCGIRVQTLDSHTAVDAAHIVPWSISHTDEIRNGMALCKLCHWTFDKGLIGEVYGSSLS
jgi:putative restriction endonuclease